MPITDWSLGSRCLRLCSARRPAGARRRSRSTWSWCSRSTSRAASTRSRRACSARATSRRCATRTWSRRSRAACSAASRVTYVEWAGDHYQRTMLDWTRARGCRRAPQAFADALAETPLATAHWTSLSGAIDYAVPLFEDNGFEGVRRVIDISGDGYNNRGRPVEQARDEAVAAGHHDQRPADRQRPPEPLGRPRRRSTSTSTTSSG